MDNFPESKPLNWSDYWNMAVRWRWWLMGPFFAVGLFAFAGGHLWPVLYRSEALILVEQQKVPEHYVTSNVVADPQDRLQSMTQQILSRTRLRRLIEQFNLYQRQRAHNTMDEVIDVMRERIRIELVQAPGRPAELTAFRIYFSAENPRLAQQVTNEITSLFIEENLQARTQQSVGTTNFLENQLEKARGELATQEERQRQYKMRFLGQLPEQQQSNLQILGSLEAQLRAATGAMERAEQQKVYLESMRGEYQAMRRSWEARSSSTPKPVVPQAADSALRDLRKQLAELEAKYTPRHPDVVKLKEEIASWERTKKRSDADAAGSAANEPAAATALDTSAIEVQSRLKAIDMEVEGQKKDVAELQGRIRNFQSRLDLTPVREQQLAEVTRSYDNSRQYFQSLLQKKLQSELATNLEKRQQGEQFRILDPASLPEKPVSPNRMQITLLGWLLGLCLGIALTTTWEITDGTLRGEQDLRRFTQAPIMVRIPILRSPSQERQAKFHRRLELAGAMTLLLLSATAGLYTYLMG